MFKLIWNLLALLGLVIVAGIIALGVQQGTSIMNLKDFDPAQHRVAPDDMVQLDRWAVDRALQLQQDIIKAYQDYNFHLIYQKVHNFCVVDLGSFYLDVIKDRQYTTPAESRAPDKKTRRRSRKDDGHDTGAAARELVARIRARDAALPGGVSVADGCLRVGPEVPTWFVGERPGLNRYALLRALGQVAGCRVGADGGISLSNGS